MERGKLKVPYNLINSCLIYKGEKSKNLAGLPTQRPGEKLKVGLMSSQALTALLLFTEFKIHLNLIQTIPISTLWTSFAAMAQPATVTLALEAAPPASPPWTDPTLTEGGMQQKVGWSHRNSKQQHAENQICMVKSRRPYKQVKRQGVTATW